jgi:Mn2+/Fe2+ NRAMP family transporter
LDSGSGRENAGKVAETPPASLGIREPPRTFLERLRYLGPSLIITGSIVGSGELIVTTTLGARMGFAALWLILLSCLIKVVVQIEIGRYTVSSGDTALTALNRLPGPRWSVSWVIWAWMAMTGIVCFQVGGIIGGVSQSLNLLFPGVGLVAWSLLISLLTLGLLLSGRYRVVEGVSAILVTAFTFTTLLSAALVQWSPHAVSPGEIASGLTFHLPPEGVAVAFAVFGITGIGTTELLYYPNWCMEKGYARFTGSPSDDPEWVRRARGWVRVMQTDAVVAMVLYTTATVAFYILGAAVLHRMGVVPRGDEMVRMLSNMFTETFGPWAFFVFVVGAFCVLYSTFFASTASNAMMVVDCVGVFGVRSAREGETRVRWLRLFVTVLVALSLTLFITFKEPVAMVLAGGMAQTALLPVVCFSALYLHYRHLDERLRPSKWIVVLLWVSSTLTLGVALYTLSRPFLS